MSLASQIESLLQEYYPDPQIKGNIQDKVIRDVIFGTKRFRGYEVEIIDLPIVQRLRRISQNGFAYFVYPGCRHSRFEHSIGVSIIAERMINAVKEKPGKNNLFNENDIIEIRLASLLHDVGHGFYSHTSERMMYTYPEFEDETQKDEYKDLDPKPHEMLSYLITKSSYMKDVFASINNKYSVTVDQQRIANYIIGKVENPIENKFKAGILNGAFDADKIDYILRDAYFSGLGLVLDLDRMFYTLDVDVPVCTDQYKKDNPGLKLDDLARNIICNVSGVGCFEQLIFNKMMLNSMMYHHHKIRAAECLLIDIWDTLRKEPTSSFTIAHLSKDGHKLTETTRFDSLVDFLKVNDEDIVSVSNYNDNKNILTLCNQLRMRNLPHRNVILSNQTIIADNVKFSSFITKRSDDLLEQIEFRNELISRVNVKLGNTDKDVWIDIPKFVSINEPKKFFVRITNKDYKRIIDLFKVDQWINAFLENKYQAIIYSRKNSKLNQTVGEESYRLLKEKYEIIFDEMAFKLAKIDFIQIPT